MPDEQHAKLTTDASVDESLTRLMTELYMLGHQSSEGDQLLAALLHFAPEWGKFGSCSIPRAWRALRGWRRRCPSRSRRPYLLEVWATLAWKMAAIDQWRMAFFTLLPSL